MALRKIESIPAVNEFGLVIPPSRNFFAFQSRKSQPDTVERHHMYWPQSAYKAKSRLALKFREHPLNSIWMLGSEHDDYHDLYDGVPIPDRDVMKIFLAEAALLDALHVNVTAIEMIDKSLYEGSVIQLKKTKEKRLRHLELIHTSLPDVSLTPVLPEIAVKLTIDRIGSLIVADAA